MIGTEAGVDLDGLVVEGDPIRYLVEFDETAVDPSAAIVAALATVTDVDPTEMAPLYESVDPEAIDAILAPAAHQGTAVSISFEVEGHGLTVSEDGVVAIDPPGTESLDDRIERGVAE